jgi:hypothetical protein
VSVMPQPSAQLGRGGTTLGAFSGEVDTGSPLRKCDHTRRKERSLILSKRDSL